MRTENPNRWPGQQPGPFGWINRLRRLLGLDTRHACGENLTLDEELQIAFRASADGDLRHATHHLAGALQINPCDRRAHQLLDRLVAKQRAAGRDPLELAPFGRRGTFSGTVAVRACILHQTGDPAEAVKLLRQVGRQDKKAPWWKLGAEWLQQADAARAADPAQSVGLLLEGLSYLEERERREPGVGRSLEELLPAIRTVAGSHRTDDSARWLEAVVVRKLGDLEKACALADALWADSPSYISATCRAVAHQCAGHIDLAARAYQDALKYRPDDPCVRADLAELHAVSRRYDEALRWAEEAKRHDAERNTSSWMLAFLLRHRLTGDPGALEGLFRFSREYRAHRQPNADVMRVLGEYLTYIPPPQEATMNAARHIAAECADVDTGSTLSMTLSALESPSSRSALERTVARLGAKLELTIESVARPDPRVPWGAAEWVIWQYDDMTPRAALPPPAPALSAAVVELARQRFDLAEWSVKAGSVARTLIASAGVDGRGVVSAIAQDLLSVMALSPPAPPEVAEWDWIRQVQMASVLIVAALDSGWEDSVRRRALVSLIRGPADWTTEVAAVALMTIFEEGGLAPAERGEIEKLLADLAGQVPATGYCCFQNVLLWAYQRLPERAQRDLHATFLPLRQEAGES